MTKFLDTLYVDISQPFTSALTASGLARLVDELLGQQTGEQRRLTLCHQGTHFAMKLYPALDLSFPFQFPADIFYLIETEKNKATLPKGTEQNRWNYQQYKARVGEYFELRRSMTPAELNSKGSLDDNPKLHRLLNLQPNETWYGMAMVNQMQALTAYNDVVTTWLQCRACWPDLFALIVQYWGSLPNNTSDALKTWQQIAKEHQIKTKEQITASQTINPEQGKGSNRSKADVLTIGNLSSFWLEEAMKFAGVFIAAIPRTVSGVKDRKTYVLLPRQTDFGTHRDVYKEFQKQLWPSTAIKMDILAALSYSKLFAAHFAEAQSEKPGMTFRPDNHVQGLATAFYKDLGSAVATMNLATVNLPDWANALDDHGKESALELVALFDEHIRIVRMLDEGKGEEEELLRSYRDFLSSRDPQLTAFFAFTNRYAAHIMSKMVRRQPVTRITTRSLEVIVMSNDQRRKPKKPLGPIITNQGFQNIAEAIRRSTVIPQYQKNQGTTTYEVRYGLGDKLKRKAHYPLQFIQELSDFMHLYNQENARIAERRQMQFRKAVTTEDIEAVAQLLDDYGDDAPAVAYLLIAYGYARDPKERDSKSGSDQPPAENSTEDIPAAEANATDTPDGTELPF